MCQSSQQSPQQLLRADADGPRSPECVRPRSLAAAEHWPPSTDARRPLVIRRASTGGGRTSPHGATTASPRRRYRPRLGGSAPAVLARLRPRACRVTGRGSSEIAVSSTVSSVPGRTASMASSMSRPCRPGSVRRGTRTRSSRNGETCSALLIRARYRLPPSCGTCWSAAMYWCRSRHGVLVTSSTIATGTSGLRSHATYTVIGLNSHPHRRTCVSIRTAPEGRVRADRRSGRARTC